jgi:hypothetical protein
MKTHTFFPLVFLVTAWCTVFTGCFSIPHLFWPQKDISPSKRTSKSAQHSVLIASRKSDFKEAVVERISSSISSGSYAVHIIGCEQLDTVNAAAYDAIVLINTCMSWAMDRNVNAFLRRTADHGRIIVLTTSADGKWAPRGRRRTFDAVTAASEMETADTVAQGIVEKIMARTR